MSIDDEKLKDFKKMLNYLPLVGISIVNLSNMTGIGYTTLYHYRNGLIPKEEKLKYIIAVLKSNYPDEYRKIKRFIQIDKEIDKEKQNAKLY